MPRLADAFLSAGCNRGAPPRATSSAGSSTNRSLPPTAARPFVSRYLSPPPSLQTRTSERLPAVASLPWKVASPPHYPSPPHRASTADQDRHAQNHEGVCPSPATDRPCPNGSSRRPASPLWVAPPNCSKGSPLSASPRNERSSTGVGADESSFHHSSTLPSAHQRPTLTFHERHIQLNAPASAALDKAVRPTVSARQPAEYGLNPTRR